MIELCEAKRFIDALPWREDDPRPAMYVKAGPQGAEVLLCDKVTRGWSDVARMAGPTLEGTLRHALEKWFAEKGLNNRPELYAAVKRLQN